MTAPVFIGDELSGAGWRLAGATVLTPPPGAEAAALAQARMQAPLVLVSAVTAAALGEPLLRAAQAAPQPLVLVVPDLQGEVALPDLAARLRGQLGLDA
jgi:vacuolar-type H+-ATPase subunit F/Vma7